MKKLESLGAVERERERERLLFTNEKTLVEFLHPKTNRKNGKVGFKTKS